MISILFCAKNSIYETLTDSAGEPLDCWDEDRDALKWPGGNPVVAHPPCRLFSQMRYLSSAPQSEKRLAYKALEWVREYGGVLEHPAMSLLWEECSLPKPGNGDVYGLCVAVNQWWWGHKMRKSTWLYVCGTKPIEIPLRIGEAEYSMYHTGIDHTNGLKKKEVLKSERGATPPAFARWLVETAERCQKVQK